MNKEQKAATVEAIAEQIQSAEAVFALDYRGISVPQAAELRARLREADATFRIVKNSLTERAADRAGAEALLTMLEGPTALTFVRGDAAAAAKALSDFARTAAVLEFKGGLMGGQELTVDEIKSIARLPARDVLYAQLVGTVASPVTGLVRGLNALIAGLAIQLKQIADQGLVGAPAQEAAPAGEAAPAEAAAPAEEATTAEEAPSAEGVPPADEALPEDEPTPAEDADSPEAEPEPDQETEPQDKEEE